MSLENQSDPVPTSSHEETSIQTNLYDQFQVPNGDQNLKDSHFCDNNSSSTTLQYSHSIESHHRMEVRIPFVCFSESRTRTHSVNFRQSRSSNAILRPLAWFQSNCQLGSDSFSTSHAQTSSDSAEYSLHFSQIQCLLLILTQQYDCRKNSSPSALALHLQFPRSALSYHTQNLLLSSLLLRLSQPCPSLSLQLVLGQELVHRHLKSQ
mmetsp:Transcript_5556/g.9768  ORF Transcript_5556/g.9768 Transcript_5556/m.9768 type:complete len:208 (-) Transcript_5556:845-1468(-)